MQDLCVSYKYLGPTALFTRVSSFALSIGLPPFRVQFCCGHDEQPPMRTRGAAGVYVEGPQPNVRVDTCSYGLNHVLGCFWIAKSLQRFDRPIKLVAAETHRSRPGICVGVGLSTPTSRPVTSFHGGPHNFSYDAGCGFRRLALASLFSCADIVPWLFVSGYAYWFHNLRTSTYSSRSRWNSLQVVVPGGPITDSRQK
jgi:hypothetical protein